VAAAYGIDPIHLGIVFLTNMELGYLMRALVSSASGFAAMMAAV